MSYVCRQEYHKKPDGTSALLYCVVPRAPDPDLYRQPLRSEDQALRLVNYLNGGSGQPFDWDMEETPVTTITPGATTEAGKGDDETQGVDTV